MPKAPTGLKASQLRPFLGQHDPRAAAQAGYLLALLGEPEGLPALVRFVRTQKDWSWTRRAVQAIAVLDDDAQTPLLRQMYKELDTVHRVSGEVKEFYWTIRFMTGPEVLKLRKEIRDEVGMTRLR